MRSSRASRINSRCHGQTHTVDSLPVRLSEFDVQQYFRLSAADVAAINERFRADRRTAVAVLLVFLRACGRPLDRFSALPKMLLVHVGEALGVQPPTIATLRSLYTRRQTLYEHQLWLKDYLGLRTLTRPVAISSSAISAPRPTRSTLSMNWSLPPTIGFMKKSCSSPGTGRSEILPANAMPASMRPF